MAVNGTLDYFIPSPSVQIWMSIYNTNMVYLLAIVSLFGVIANAINICVFLKQGFRDKVNISLLALALSDLGTLLSALIMSACSNPALLNSGLPVAFDEVQTVITRFPRATFSRITNCITTYITFERCMCVVFPMKVKRIITARVTVVTLTVFFLTLFSTMIPPYIGASVGWRYDVFSNRTVLSMSFDKYQGSANIKAILNLHTCIQITSFVLVTIFTLVLAVELMRKSRWRHLSNTHRNDNSSKNTKRKVSTTISMVTAMAVIYISCYSVSVGHLIYNAMSSYYVFYLYDVFLIVLSSAFVLETINSSLGIFLYYAMSTKYKATFKQLFLPCCYAKSTKQSVASCVDSHETRSYIKNSNFIETPTKRQ